MKYTPRELRSFLFYLQRNDNRPRSRRQLCEMIQRKKSPHIIDVIEQLVTEGCFEKWAGTDKQGRGLWLYRAVDKDGSAQQHDNA